MKFLELSEGRCTGINIFTIEYESAFKKELNEILNYITNQLHNEYAAKRLLQSIDTAVIKRNLNNLVKEENIEFINEFIL